MLHLEVVKSQFKHNGMMLQVETFVEKSPYHTYITYSVFDETMTGHENHIFKLVSYTNV